MLNQNLISFAMLRTMSIPASPRPWLLLSVVDVDALHLVRVRVQVVGGELLGVLEEAQYRLAHLLVDPFPF